MAKIVGKTLGMVGYGSGGLGTNNWASDMEANLRKIDAILQAGAIAIQNAPPGSPVDGQVYVVGTAPTGAWSGNANAIARLNGNANPSPAWEFFTPAIGWWIAVSGSDYRWSGSAWVQDLASSHAPQHEFGGSQPITGSNIIGLRPVDSPEFLRAYIGSDIRLKRSGVFEWGLQAGTAGFELASRNADWSAIDWPITIGHDAGGVIRLGGTTNRPVNLTYSLQLGGVDTITSGREGRFTGLRLTNLSSGQIPVCSDGNGQVTASGLTDDGSILRSIRTMCHWSTMARSGSTWTDLQWTPDVQERVSIFSSNGAGSAAYHTLAIVPPDAEATSRTLGVIAWGQKVSGKSAANAGLKAVIVADSIGAGGSVSGFGSRFRIRYMPDNGAAMVDAMRIGAFGGSTPDAVQADILLRANAGIESLGMTWAAYGGRTGLLPSSINPASGVFGFSVDSAGDVDIDSPSETRMLIDRAEILRLDTASIVSSRLLQTPNIKLTGLGEAGNLYADANGNVSVKTVEMFRGSGSVPVPDGIEHSVLGQSSSRRLIPANSVATGDELTLIVDFKSRVDDSAQTWNIYIGPDGTYTASYRPSFTFSNQQLGNPTGNYNHRITFLVRFIVSGSDVICRGRMVIERSQFDAYNSGMDHVYSTDFTITYPRSSARFIDLTAQMSNANTSLFEFFLTSCVYRKAI